MSEASPIILAVDTIDLDRVSKLILETRPFVEIYKFGLEFYLHHGLQTLEKLQREHEIRIFLDLKLHDIPNTVGKAASTFKGLEPFILTVHASGGSEMVKAAVLALPMTAIAAVTVLTSLDQDALVSMGLTGKIDQLVRSLAGGAIGAGARAIVASPHEVAALRSAFPSAMLITPGIRISQQENDDQKRIMTPRDAIRQGSDFLVIGRPITADPSPAEAAKRILASLD